MSATLGLPDSIEIVVAIAENHSNICKFDKEDDTYELVIENIADLVHLATVPRTRLSVPSMFLQDAQTTQRRLSVTSFKSDDNLSNSSVPSIPLDTRFGMPTYSNSDLNSVSSGDITHQQSSESSASSISTSPVILMPYSENPDFIGREDIFETVKTILQSKSRGQKRVALHGLGGVGYVISGCPFHDEYAHNNVTENLKLRSSIHTGTSEPSQIIRCSGFIVALLSVSDKR